MWQTNSSSARRTAGSFQSIVKIRREKCRRTDSRATRQLGHYDAVAIRDEGSDWSLVQQAIAGNAYAQEQLFSHRTDRLYRTAFSVLRNKEDAEDALQDGLWRAYTRLEFFQGRSSFSTWLTRIVINSALMIRRRRNVHPEASLDEILESRPQRFTGFVDTRPDPEKICAAIEVNTLVDASTCQLPPRLRVAFRLRAESGFSVRESSQALGIATGAFKSRISRARRKLAQGLRASLETKTRASSSTGNKAIEDHRSVASFGGSTCLPLQ